MMMIIMIMIMVVAALNSSKLCASKNELSGNNVVTTKHLSVA